MHDQVVQIKDQDDGNVSIPRSVKELIANPVLFYSAKKSFDYWSIRSYYYFVLGICVPLIHINVEQV